MNVRAKLYPILQKSKLDVPLRVTRDKIARPIKRRYSFKRRLSRISEEQFNGKNVILIVIDCLRSDHTSLKGYDRDTTPFINNIGVRYPNTITAAPWTFPAVSSILTGKYPHNNGTTYENNFRNLTGTTPPDLPNSPSDDVLTLSELLGSAGYSLFFSTAIAMAEIPLRTRFPRIEVEHMRPANKVVSSLLDWWRAHPIKNKFAYIHLGDLHGPLSIPNSTPFGEIEDVQNIRDWDFRDSTEPQSEFERYRQERVKLYDTLLREVDKQLEYLYNKLEEENNMDDTVMVIVGDHGEAFWEHSHLEKELFDNPRGWYGIGHGDSLFQERVQVPLAIVGSELESHVNDDFVSTVDIMPTILNELDSSDHLIRNCDGVSLQEDLPTRPVISEVPNHGYSQKSVVYDGFKYIREYGNNVELLYNLNDDPTESKNLLGDGTHSKKNQLRKFLPSGNRKGTNTNIDRTTHERLEDLGYVE
jgi:arylsulfatase A-like enzyme